MSDHKKLLEFVVPSLAVAFSVYYLSTVWGAPWEASFYAYALIAGIFICALIIVFQTIRQQSVPKKDASKSRFFWLLAASAAFVAGIYFIGYVASTFLFVLIAPLMMGYRNWKAVLIMDIIFVAAVYILFIMILRVDLPVGLIFQ